MEVSVVMDYEQRRIFDKIIKIKNEFGDQEFATELVKVIQDFECKEIIKEEVDSDILLHLEYYLDAKKFDGITQGTLDNYERAIKKLAEAFPNRKVSDISLDDLRSYIMRLPGIKKATSRNTVTSQIKSFFAWLKYEDYIHKDPSLKLKLMKVPKRLRTGLSITELEKVRIACVTKRERALVELLFATGCRISEIAALNRDDLNMSDFTINVIGKGNQEHTVCFNEKATLYLKYYLDERTDDNPALFVSERKPYQRLKRRALGLIVTKIYERTDLDEGLYPHKFRHTFATLALQSGMDLTSVQKLLGHSSPEMTLRYAEQSLANIKHSYHQKMNH